MSADSRFEHLTRLVLAARERIRVVAAGCGIVLTREPASKLLMLNGGNPVKVPYLLGHTDE